MQFKYIQIYMYKKFYKYKYTERVGNVLGKKVLVHIRSRVFYNLLGCNNLLGIFDIFTSYQHHKYNFITKLNVCVYVWWLKFFE